MAYADSIVAESLLNPDARHKWEWGVHPAGLRRGRAIHKLLLKAGIKAEFGRDRRYSPGVCYVTFPCADYRRAEEIADRCYVGESWWPGKPKPRTEVVLG